MTLLERLGKKENKNNGKIFAGRTDKIIEQGYQDLKIACLLYTSTSGGVCGLIRRNAKNLTRS